MSHRTKEEITTEIEALRELKPRCRRISFFGDNHHNAIDAQIAVLNEVMDEDDLESVSCDDDWTEYEKEQATEALHWMEGDSDERPSDGWKSICN